MATRLICCFVMLINTASSRVQIKDLLDDCDWCKEQSTKFQALDLSDWKRFCMRKPKPVWFTHKTLGRCYGNGVNIDGDKWLYTKKHGLVYYDRTHKNYYYKKDYGWLYIKDGLTYDFVKKRWLNE